MKSILKIITDKRSLLLLISLFVVVFDQYTKYLVVQNFRLYESHGIIDGFLKFTYVHNTGAAFSFGDKFPDWIRLIIFKILPVAVGGYLLKLIYTDGESKLMKVAYAFILGGGAGNVIDRIRLDYVVDFISVYHRGLDIFGLKLEPWSFAIFNIADSAVSLAAILIILDYFINQRKQKPIEESQTVSSQ